MLVIESLQSLWRPLRPHTSRAGRDDNVAIGDIRDVARQLQSLSEAGFRQRADDLRLQVQKAEESKDSQHTVASFALTLEAIRRTLEIELYDVQLLAGLALSRHSIAEMRTGEGKTFVTSLPATLHAMSGKGVHVMTVNSYLARRDCELLMPAFRLLGLTVGLTESGAPVARKKAAYECDITYGPGYEFGFDYLRDQWALLKKPAPRLGEDYWDKLRGQEKQGPMLMQRGHPLAIIDEIDSVLLDEATTPMILTESAPTPAKDAEAYIAAAQCVDTLEEPCDFVVDSTLKMARLTERGKELVCSYDAIPNQDLRRSWPAYIEQALKAKLFMQRDVDYVIDAEGKVLIVDLTTGRIFEDRSWRDGLQQAVQAKEGVPITSENQPVVRISRQKFFALYDHLCGMTGTAQGSDREFRKTYRLEIVDIPPRKESQFVNLPMRSYASREAKHEAILAEIVRVWRTGQPILVGTATIRDSEYFAERLRAESVPFQLLNGTQDEEEARIVARAGRRGQVTIATNMAGRGTDIKLGSGVPELGGLYVLGCEPQESARVDRQLLGRAARQGDPGCGRLFVSADDPVIQRFSPALSRRMQRLPTDDAGELQADLSRDVTRLQGKVETHHFRNRWRMFLHDDWLESVLDKLAK